MISVARIVDALQLERYDQSKSIVVEKK